jgi:hypothetical protein
MAGAFIAVCDDATSESLFKVISEKEFTNK